MKINPIINPNILRTYQATRPVKDSKTEMKRDEVTFSSEALSFSKKLSEARQAIETRTPAELAHIAEIKQAVKDGTYNVDSIAVAERMLGY